MLNFHTNIFAFPGDVESSTTIQLRGLDLLTLTSPDGGPPRFTAPLPASFEEIQRWLLKIPRMDIEPDGYFIVAGGESEGQRWQIDGHLFEYNGQMHRVEMHGNCSEATFDQLLSCFGWPEAQVVFELVQEGVTLDEEHFRQWARC